MPQLDINTFLNQYSSIIFTLIIVYVMLSFIILPILINTLLVRARSVTPTPSKLDVFDSKSKINLARYPEVLFSDIHKNIFLGATIISSSTADGARIDASLLSKSLNYNSFTSLLSIKFNSYLIEFTALTQLRYQAETTHII